MRLPISPVILVLSCTVSDILQVFVLMTPPLFHPNFGVVPAGPDRRCWGQCEHVKIFLKYSDYVIAVPERHRGTDITITIILLLKNTTNV